MPPRGGHPSRKAPAPRQRTADELQARLIAAQLKSLEDRDTRDAEAHRLKMQREAELHAATLAKLNAPVAAQAAQDAPGSPIEGRSVEPLPPGAGDLVLQIPGLNDRDILAVWKGSFEPDNLARLRSLANHQYRGNITTLVDGVFESGPPKADLKPLHTPSTYFECFNNYIIIVVTLCQCPLGLAGAMLTFVNKIRSLSTYYIWNGAVLQLALAWHRIAMSRGQTNLENWKIPVGFESTFTTPMKMIGVSEHLSIRGAAIKRPRADTRHSPPPEHTCNKFNAGQCKKEVCRYTHKCSKCFATHPAKDCTA
jgi:hypothetical protein